MNWRDFAESTLGWLKRERLLTVLLLLSPLLLLLSDTSPAEIPRLIHWQTIAALAGLMLLSSAVQWSGLIDWLARDLLRRLSSERLLACTLCLLAGALAAVITNDVALFLVIPLTLALGKIARLPIVRLVVFQTLAVNAGSSLSPIGNPQNLFLWQTSGSGFFSFIHAMLPLTFPFALTLGTGILIAFRPKKIELEALPDKRGRVNRRLFWPTLALYPLFLAAIEFGYAMEGTLLLLFIYGSWQKKRLWQVDWALLLLFVLMFSHLGMLARLSVMQALAGWLLEMPGAAFTGGILLSQLISNVPATIFLQPFTDDWKTLAWGVNIGGFGLAVGSLANLIALRLAKQPGLISQFHFWSIPCLIFCWMLGSLLL